MQIAEFKLERYFAKYEFQVQYLLSASDCETFSLKALLELTGPRSMEMWNNLRLGYTETSGHPVLKEEIARLYRGIWPENVLVAAPEEAIFIALNTMLEQGDHIIIVDPVYQSMHEIPRSLGCSITTLPLYVENEAWTVDLDVLERGINDKTKMIVLNFPHNPTGHLLTQSEQERIVGIARRHGIYIFSDEMYWMSEHNTVRIPAICEVYEKGVSLFGMSKTFGLPGLRIGWLVTQNSDLMRKFTAFKDYTTICSSAPSEILAIIGLQAKDEIISRNMEIVRTNNELATQFFNGHRDLFEWISPKGGTTAFPELISGQPVEEFCQDLLNKKNVMILPGSVFDFGGNRFRVGLGRSDFPKALQKLGEYMEEYKR